MMLHNIHYFIIKQHVLKFDPVSGCRIMAITPASQAGDVSSILITRSIQISFLTFAFV